MNALVWRAPRRRPKPSTADATPRQLEILRFIADHIGEHGFAPTVQEIGDAHGIKSKNATVDHLRALMAKGLLEHSSHKARSFTLTKRGRLVLGIGTAESSSPLREAAEAALCWLRNHGATGSGPLGEHEPGLTDLRAQLATALGKRGAA